MATSTRQRAFYDCSNVLRNDGIIETCAERRPGRAMAVSYSEAFEYAERLRQEEIEYFERQNAEVCAEINKLTREVVENSAEINRLKSLDFRVR